VPGEFRFGDTRHILSDITSIGMLGWSPQRTPADSVAAYAEWLEGVGSIDGVLDEATASMRSLGVVRSVES
jgi:dTDP-L-rhamnose 4-epimerase